MQSTSVVADARWGRLYCVEGRRIKNIPYRKPANPQG
jgi:hypothetical protein